VKLNGWRRLWIIWCVVAIPLSFVMSSATSPRRGVSIQQAKLGRLQAAYSRASDRRTSALERELGPATDAAEIGRRASIVLTELRGDALLREEQAAIDAEFASQIDEADRADRQESLTMTAIFWLMLVIGAYAVGATVAWVRRGFQRNG
jgi:hypothetical protein